MKTESTQSSLFHAMLDGTLDAAGEKSVLSLLASDPAARQEFARLTQLHAWLAADDRTRSLLRAPVANPPRRVISRSAWWLAAAVAAAIIVFTASKLWPFPGSQLPLAYGDSLQPMLHAACAQCHGNMAGFLTGKSAAGLAMIVPGQPEKSALWIRLSGDNPCARCLDESGKSLVREWITDGRHVSAAS